MKRVCYVVPIEPMVESIRLAAVETSLQIYPIALAHVYGLNDTCPKPQMKEEWIKVMMSNKRIYELVRLLETQLFARLLRDIYLSTSSNIIQSDLLYQFRNRLRHQHFINEELLFKQVFEEYLQFKDLPINLTLNYDGRSLYIEI